MRVPLHHAVLALLVQGPGHGYDLKGEFTSLVGPHFGTLSIGHLYQLLERLARGGLAETHREPQEARPDRLVYTLTDAGRTELASWFDAPVKITSGYRDDFFLKLAAARSLGDAGLIRRIVDARRTALLKNSTTWPRWEPSRRRPPATVCSPRPPRSRPAACCNCSTRWTPPLTPLWPASGTARVRVNGASVGRRRTASWAVRSAGDLRREGLDLPARALRLVGVDGVGVLKGDADVVKAVEEAVPGLRSRRSRRGRCRRPR